MEQDKIVAAVLNGDVLGVMVAAGEEGQYDIQIEAITAIRLFDDKTFAQCVEHIDVNAPLMTPKNGLPGEKTAHNPIVYHLENTLLSRVCIRLVEVDRHEEGDVTTPTKEERALMRMLDTLMEKGCDMETSVGRSKPELVRSGHAHPLFTVYKISDRGQPAFFFKLLSYVDKESEPAQAAMTRIALSQIKRVHGEGTEVPLLKELKAAGMRPDNKTHEAQYPTVSLYEKWYGTDVWATCNEGPVEKELYDRAQALLDEHTAMHHEDYIGNCDADDMVAVLQTGQYIDSEGVPCDTTRTFELHGYSLFGIAENNTEDTEAECGVIIDALKLVWNTPVIELKTVTGFTDAQVDACRTPKGQLDEEDYVAIMYWLENGYCDWHIDAVLEYSGQNIRDADLEYYMFWDDVNDYTECCIERLMGGENLPDTIRQNLNWEELATSCAALFEGVLLDDGTVMECAN